MKNNPMALTGFIFGLVSMVLYYIGILPTLGIIFSSIGLGTFKPDIHKNRWMAAVGLILGILYTLMSMREHGHLG
jgi:hypothetical protein